MADRESVITHLQIIHTWAEFARERDLQFFTAKHLEDIAKWTDDAIELLKVRCRDCKYYIGEGHYCKTRGLGRALKPDDFCSDGKRR